MRHKFGYVKAGVLIRPIIPVSLRLNSREIKYFALLDSGADFNIFHGAIAKLLKTDLEKVKATTVSGISGEPARGYFVSVDIGINDEYINSPVIFSNDISDDGYGILGQQGFFNHFGIYFDYLAKEIIIER